MAVQPALGGYPDETFPVLEHIIDQSLREPLSRVDDLMALRKSRISADENGKQKRNIAASDHVSKDNRLKHKPLHFLILREQKDGFVLIMRDLSG